MLQIFNIVLHGFEIDSTRRTLTKIIRKLELEFTIFQVDWVISNLGLRQLCFNLLRRL